MAYSSTVSSKGQVTVPQEIRTRLGLKEGDRLEFAIEGSRTVIRPVRGTPNPFAAYVGALGTFPRGERDIATWIAELRDEPSPDRPRAPQSGRRRPRR
jgi:antitoxin PrlF